MAEKETKVNPIVIEMPDSGKKYTLTFTRETVLEAEAEGFAIDEIDKFPLTRIPQMIYYAFMANHRNEVTKEDTDRILDELGGIPSLPEGLLKRLGELYGNAFKSTTTNPRIKVKF